MTVCRPVALAVCMITRGPAERVASILSPLRDRVDEIVVAADAGGDPALESLRGVYADDVAWFRSPGSLEAVLLWALRRCRSDWIVRLDDDEAAPPVLFDEVRALEGDEATHAVVPCRWLWPDPGAWWASPPLGHDLKLRVLRNVPGLWRQDPAPHAPLAVLGPERVLTAPIYHGALLVSDETERRTKAASYERAASGHRLEDVATNAVYVPEDFFGLATRPVDAAHRDAVTTIFGNVHVAPSSVPPHPASADTLLALTSRPNLDGAHQGEVRVRHAPGQFAGGLAHMLVVEVVNRSPVMWPATHAADSPVRVGLEWEHGGVLPRLLFPAPVPPGATALLRLILTVPVTPGRYRLRLQLVHEHVAWFGDEATFEVDVVQPTATGPPYQARQAAFEA